MDHGKHKEPVKKAEPAKIVGADKTMDIAEIIRKIRVGIDAARNGNFVEAAMIGFELMLEFLQSIRPMGIIGNEEAKFATAQANAKGLTELSNDIETLCNKLSTKTAKGEAEVDLNPIIAMLWPLLKAWLAKILERL